MEQPLEEHATFDRFLSLLAASEKKLEFFAGTILAFAGGTLAHATLAARLYERLRGAAQPGCTVFNSDVALATGASSYVFPDVSYTCEPIDWDATRIVAPRLVVEVITQESVDRDRVEKLDLYRSMASVLEYVLVDSRRRWIAVEERTAGGWTSRRYEASRDVMRLGSLPLAFSLEELYAGIR